MGLAFRVRALVRTLDRHLVLVGVVDAGADIGAGIDADRNFLGELAPVLLLVDRHFGDGWVLNPDIT